MEEVWGFEKRRIPLRPTSPVGLFFQRVSWFPEAQVEVRAQLRIPACFHFLEPAPQEGRVPVFDRRSVPKRVWHPVRFRTVEKPGVSRFPSLGMNRSNGSSSQSRRKGSFSPFFYPRRKRKYPRIFRQTRGRRCCRTCKTSCSE